eukprot:TRINITY_DN2566_c0_g1_i1.p1 TRINITY_DN2566_c0_g1~~TRINITY_DN2566_c0_g1_i1.p1  ORF type:complete len:156 (+),score=38.01 TRINITY_DN2566_c0_g1_i1:132-599(+)
MRILRNAILVIALVSIFGAVRVHAEGTGETNNEKSEMNALFEKYDPGRTNQFSKESYQKLLYEVLTSRLAEDDAFSKAYRILISRVTKKWVQRRTEEVITMKMILQDIESGDLDKYIKEELTSGDIDFATLVSQIEQDENPQTDQGTLFNFHDEN